MSEDLIDCIVCNHKMKLVLFKTKQSNINNTKTIFKCKKCGQVMVRVDTWPKKQRRN